MDMSSMAMSMPMASSSSMGSMSMAVPTSTGMTAMSSSTMDSMSMSSPMPMSMMNMVFFTSTHTALYSESWIPQSTGAYAGTCIFLIFLAISLRAMIAYKTLQELRWRERGRRRRYVVVAKPTPTDMSTTQANEEESDSEDEDGQAAGVVRTKQKGVLTTNGMSEEIRVVESYIDRKGLVQPWRLSVDLTRALMLVAIVGVSYLL
ncbi:MAG: hypothetical protein M1828_006198 [Chrysothrix sp. TS-e1954]|nr:MAG: hypothetical protein M1828_006198 [Chrysothrix sp. TS-e1954]